MSLTTAPWGSGESPYIIAEIGSNHDGDKARALDLIKQSAAAGAHAAKFQLFKAETLVLPEHPAFETFARLSTPLEWLPELREACQDTGIHFSATPFDLEAVDALAACKPDFIKIASSDITFVSLLRQCAHTKRPVLLSTGMSTYEEVSEALVCLKTSGANDVALLHCVSMYPPEFADMNLSVIPELRTRFNCPVGLSDHTPGTSMAVASTALGGNIVEKHVTDDKQRSGPDHPYALEFDELTQLIREVANTSAALGNASVKGPQRDESIIRVKARRGLYAATDLQAGQKISLADLVALRPTAEVNAEEVDKLIGQKLLRPVAAGTPLALSMVEKA